MDNNTHQETEPQGTSANRAEKPRESRGFLQWLNETLFVKDGQIRYWRSFAVGAVAIALAAYIFPYFLKWKTGVSAISSMGTYGDLYGGLNTFFAGLAFVGLIITIIIQHQEMRETREEFEEQTNLMLRQNINTCMFDQINFMYRLKERMENKSDRSSSVFHVRENMEFLAEFCREQMHNSEKLVSKDVVDKINALRAGLNGHNSWCSLFVSWCMRIDRIAPSSEVGEAVNDEFKYYYWNLLHKNDRLYIYLNSLIYRDVRENDASYIEKFKARTPYIKNSLKEMGYNDDSYTILRHLLNKHSSYNKNTVILEKKEVEEIFEKFNDDDLKKYTLR